MESEAVRKARAARQASYALANADTTVKNKALSYIADDLLAHAGDIMDANAADVAAAREKGMSDAMIDRLTLTQDRIQGMAEGVRQVIALPDPVGQTLSSWDRPNGLHIDKVTVPLGVIAIIFESRPNVTVDAAVLCLKSGNATVLRGGSEAIRSNVALAGVIRHAIARAGLPSDAVTIMENTDRALVSELLTLRQYINLAIPRGGAGLIRMVVDTYRSSKRVAVSAMSMLIKMPISIWLSVSLKMPKYPVLRPAMPWKPCWFTRMSSGRSWKSWSRS